MKLLIVEDQAMIRQLLAMACQKALPDGKILSAANGAEGLALCAQEQPDLVVLDLVMPDCDGLDLVPELRRAADGVKILVLSSHADEFKLHRSQQVGVNGFVDKGGQALAVLEEALLTILNGHSYYCSVMRSIRVQMREDPLSFSKVLSDREMELLTLLGKGLSNEDIGTRLGLSATTVRNHRQNIMTKLGLGSTPQLIHYALSKGFVRTGP